MAVFTYENQIVDPQKNVLLNLTNIDKTKGDILITNEMGNDIVSLHNGKTFYSPNTHFHLKITGIIPPDEYKESDIKFGIKFYEEDTNTYTDIDNGRIFVEKSDHEIKLEKTMDLEVPPRASLDLVIKNLSTILPVELSKIVIEIEKQ